MKTYFSLQVLKWTIMILSSLRHLLCEGVDAKASQEAGKDLDKI